MSNKYMKKKNWSTPLTISKLPTKTTMRCHRTPVRIFITQKEKRKKIIDTY